MKNHEQLRKSLDGNEGFMRGFQIGKMKTHRRQKTPSWVNSNKEVQRILLTAFPELKTNPKQRKAAARWTNVIHFYYRMHYTYTQVSEELDISKGAVMSVLRSIKRVAANKRADGSKVRKGGRWPKHALGTKLPL